MPNQHPIAFVHGLMGFGPGELGDTKYWGHAFEVESPIDRRYEASVGPISSAHDRACELAAQIKGIRVDYGEQHSLEAGHEQYGDDFSNRAFVPEWDEDHPVHLVGHSLGGPTIRCLQHLLAVDYWGWGSNHRWVHSINAISGVLNGTSLVCFFGADDQTGLMDRHGIASRILHMVEVHTGLTNGAVEMEHIYDYDLDHWGFRRKSSETLHEYIERVSTSRFLWEKDNAPYSLTLQGAYETNKLWQTYADTYYFSYVTEKTVKESLTGKYLPRLTMLTEMQALSAYVGQKKFKEAPIPIDPFDSSDWWENDGLVPTYSQMFPRTNGRHPVGGEFEEENSNRQFDKGAWHYSWLRGMDHLDVCVTPAKSLVSRQKDFYGRLYQRLADLP